MNSIDVCPSKSTSSTRNSRLIFSNSITNIFILILHLVNVRVAFGNDDESDRNEFIDEPSTPITLPYSTRTTNDNQSIDRSFQKEFFTVHHATVEVILEDDTLSWATVTSESEDEASRRKSSNSVNLHDVFAIAPIHTHWNWSLNVNENIARSTASTANTSTSVSTPPASSKLSQSSILRGFQLHSYQNMEQNILQEILVIFQSDDSNQIERWFQFLSKIIAECMFHMNTTKKRPNFLSFI